MALTYVEHFSVPNKTSKRLVVWLHGLGDSGHGWIPAVRYLQPNAPTHFVLPNAPMRPITINGGHIMPGWYDIANMDFRDRGDEAGIRESTQAIQELIDTKIKQGTPSTDIILAGFSQGGAIALHTGLRCPYPLGGILALSTYLPLHDTLNQEAHSANASTPISMMHGTYDNVIPMAIAQKSFEFLTKHGYPIDWKTYPMAHEACSDELQDIDAWIDSRPLSKNHAA